ISMNPPPPRFPAAGQVTASAKATATAASTALPPFFITSTPTRDAMSLVDDTIPWCARSGGCDAANAGVAVQRRKSAKNLRIAREVYALAPVIGVQRHVVVAEVGGEDD